MGNFEKLIVLVVLFAAAVVLALNFTGGGEVEASDPLAGAEEVLGAQPAVTEPDPEALSPLLHAGSESLEPDPEPEPAPAGLQPMGEGAPAVPAAGGLVADESDPTRPILLDTAGLRPSFLDEYMVYTVGEGDTWLGLAQRFYQDARFTRNLMQANEDLVELAPGADILVPVHDVIAADASRAAAEQAALAESAPLSAPSYDASESTAGSAGRPPAPKPSTPTATPAGEYVVQPGDTLSDIALAAFGSSSRWKDLLAANQGLLERPESLRAGMKLTIPAGGKVPSGTVASRTEKKAEPKPASGTSASTGTSTAKKKKVL